MKSTRSETVNITPGDPVQQFNPALDTKCGVTAVYATVTCRVGGINYTFDDAHTDPTATGHVLSAGGTVFCEDASVIKNFRYRATVAPTTVFITYEIESEFFATSQVRR